nr:unnamed protein product [Spirometra erinaceieuropaei]
MARLVLESWSSVGTINRAIDLHPAYQALRTRLQSVQTGPTVLASESRLLQQLSPSQQGEGASRRSHDERETSPHRRAQTAERDSHMQRQLIGPSDYEVRAHGHTGLAAITTAGQGAEATGARHWPPAEEPKPIPSQKAAQSSTYFTFDGTIYEQVKGMPMGSTISVFIIEAVLQRLDLLVLQRHRPKFWARYVDNTFVVIDRNRLLTLKEHLNEVFPDIKFTMEEEENNQLAFLDVLVCRKDCGELKTKVFRKATNTMQVLNFNSNHPISHKRSCVRTLYRRVETQCTEPEDKIFEPQHLRWVFKANGYPRNFFDRCIRKRDERPDGTDMLPHFKSVSEAVSCLLVPLGVGVARRPEATIRRQVMKLKDPLPRLETSGVVYRIWCSCGQSNYVGETGRQLQTRMAEHAAAVRRNDASSQVAAHSTRFSLTFKFDEAEILARGDAA